MSASPGRFEGRAAELRSAFDRAFAAPVRIDAGVKHDLLAIRVGAEPCALRLAEVAGIFADQKITRVPQSDAALLGIAGFRGALMPIYSLPILLGQPAPQPPRWLAVAAAAPVALAFDVFEGHVRASADAIVTQPPQAQMRGYAAAFIRTADVVRTILNLAAVIAAIGATQRREALQTEE